MADDEENVEYLMQMGFQRKASARATELLWAGQNSRDHGFNEAREVLETDAASPKGGKHGAAAAARTRSGGGSLCMLVIVASEFNELDRLEASSAAVVAAQTHAFRTDRTHHNAWVLGGSAMQHYIIKDVDVLASISACAAQRELSTGTSSGAGEGGSKPGALAVGPCPQEQAHALIRNIPADLMHEA